MDIPYFQNESFDKENTLRTPFIKGDYEGCAFSHCDFTQTSLSGFHFSECRFTDCNLSLTRLDRSTFQDVSFMNCKLLGLHFEDCDSVLFTVSFEGCQLNLSSFFQMRMKKTKFLNCNLSEVDFTDADLSQSVFRHSDLSKAVFENTVLEKCDLRDTLNLCIDPTINKIRKARFSSSSLPGLLQRYEIEID